MTYVGRFAPSPTGPLHAGSLLTAVASYLHARQAGGEWLVRIEDIDPPREAPGAADEILRALVALELDWDRSVLYQSTRRDAYQHAVERLLESGWAFPCACSRSTLRAHAASHGAHAGYPGICRGRNARERTGRDAIRVRVDGGWAPLDDGLQGRIEPEPPPGFADYVVWRRDGLPAYHLAVVVDDAFQGVTDIVRGNDLLGCVPPQRHLQRALGLPHPAYYHVPVVTAPDGQKLSKQTGAAAVGLRNRSRTAEAVLRRLGAAPPPELTGARPRDLWDWAKAHWGLERLRRLRALAAEPG